MLMIILNRLILHELLNSSKGQECQSSCTFIVKVWLQLNAKYLPGEAILIFHPFYLIEHSTHLYFNLQMN